MKQGKSLQELALELDRQAKSKQDVIAPTKLLSIAEDSSLLVPAGGSFVGGNFGMTQIFEDQAATALGYPRDFWRSTKQQFPDQWRGLTNAMLATQDTPRMVRMLDGNARAFLSNKYRIVDNYDMANVVFETVLGKAGFEIVACEVTDKKLYIKVLTPLRREVAVGDEVQAGFVISNSEVGLGSASVETLIYRLVCSNGMISGTGLRKTHLGRALGGGEDSIYNLLSDKTKDETNRVLMLQIRDVVGATVNEIGFGKIVERFAEAKKLKIEGYIPGVVEVAAKRFGFGEGERSGILHKLIEGADLSQFGLVNAVTAHAQTVESFDRSVELERIGGDILDLPQSEWISISTVKEGGET